MKRVILFFLIFASYAMHLLAQDNFPYPSVPTNLTTPAERANYVVRHYWDHINFADTTLIHSNMLEQGFVNFIDLLPRLGNLEKTGIQIFADHAFGKSPASDTYLKELAERYLYTSTSPMRNDTLYIHLLEALNTLPSTAEAEKEQNNFLIKALSKNKIGDIATDFEYTDLQGKTHHLSEVHTPYVILYFYDPDCETCHQVEKQMQQEPLLKESLSTSNNQQQSTTPKITLIKVNAMARKDIWRDYYFRSFPALYLLDANHRVVLKDTELTKIINTF